MMCSSIHTHRFLLGPPETSVCLCLFPHVLCSLCSEGGRGLHSACVSVCVCARARVCVCVTSLFIRREKQGYRVTESNFSEKQGGVSRCLEFLCHFRFSLDG